MTNRENYISIARRTGYEYMPIHIDMCPIVRKKFYDYLAEHDLFLPQGPGYCPDLTCESASAEYFRENFYRGNSFAPGTTVDHWGVAHEPSPTSFHMSKMYHPMENFDSVEQVESYPFPTFLSESFAEQEQRVSELHAQDKAVIGGMQCTIWEVSWYLRGMENLMCDMMTEDPMAEAILDRITDFAIQRATSYAKAGVDAIFLGDDVGMQYTTMMSEGLYCEWLKPRIKKVIDAARAIRPELLVFYHSCGHVTEFIPHFIDVGIDVLNPIQPESMDFPAIHKKYSDAISFHGTIGTQTVMPFGTPKEVREKVFEHLDLAGEKGGLYVCPTHVLEPEVPVENVVAYIQACVDYTSR